MTVSFLLINRRRNHRRKQEFTLEGNGIVRKWTILKNNYGLTLSEIKKILSPSLPRWFSFYIYRRLIFIKPKHSKKINLKNTCEQISHLCSLLNKIKSNPVVKCTSISKNELETVGWKIHISEYFVRLHGYLFCLPKLSDQTWWVLSVHHPLDCFTKLFESFAIYRVDLWNDPISPSVFTFVNPEPMSISITEILSPWKTVISLPDCALF